MEAEVNSVKAATDVDEPSPPPAESQPESGTAAPLFTLPFALYLKPLPTIIYQSVPKNIHQDGSTSDSDSSSDSSSSNHSTSESDEPQSPTARRKHSKSISLGPNAKLIPTKLRSDPHDLNTLEAVLSVANPQAASQPVAKLLSLLSNADSSPGFDRLREFFDTRFDLPSPSTSSIPVDTKSQQRKTSLPTTLSKLRKASNSNSRNPSFSQRKHEEHLKDDIEALESASAFNPSLYTTSQTSEGEDLPGPLFQHSTSPKRHPTSTSRSKSSITRSLSSNNNKKRSSKAPRIVLPARKSSTGGGAGISSGGGAQKTIPPKVIRFPVRLDLHSVRLASKPKLQKSRSIVSRGSSFGGGGGRFRNKRNGRGLGRKQASAEGALQFRTPSTSSLRKGAVSRSRRVASDTESHLSGINGSGFNSEAAGFQSGHALEPVASPESGYHGSLNDNGDGNNHSGWTLSTSPEKAAINGNESSSNAYNGISTSSVNGTNSRGNSSATPSSWRGGNASSVTSASISGGGDRKDSFVSGTGSAVASSGQEGNRRPSMVQRFLDFGGLRKKGRSRSGTGGSEMSRKSASSASADEINIQQQSSIPPVPNLPSVIASSQAQDFPSTLKIVGLDQHEGILASPIDLVSPRTEIKMPSFQPQSKDLNLSKTISTSSGSDDANHAVEDEDDADDVEAHWSRRRAAKVSKSGSRTESFGDSGRRLFKSSSTSAFAASEHDLGPVREGHAWAASSGTQDLNEEEDSFDEEEDERSLWDEDGSEAFPMEEGEDFLSLLREAAKLSLSPEILQSAVEQQDNIASGLESRGSQSQTPRGGSSPRNSLHHLSEKAKGKLPESSSGSRSPLTPNGKLSELPSLLTSSSSSSLRQVTPPGSFEMERQAEMNADVEAIAEANSRAEERFKDLEKAHWWPSGSSDPFPVVISLALGLHFGWEGIMNLCYGHGSNSCPEAPKGQDSSLAGGDFAPLGRAADMEERGRRGAGRVSDWWAGVQNAQELEANTSAVDEDEDKKNQDASVPDTSTRNDANDSQSSPSEVVVDDDEFDPDQAGRERTNSTRFGKWLGIKGRGGSMSSSKGPGSGSFRRSSTSAGSESQDGNGSNQPPSPSASQLGEIRARERLNSQQKNLQKEKEDRNRTWKDWYNLCKSIKGWVEAYELARIRAGLSREIGVEPPPSALLQSQSNEQKLDSALSDEDDEIRALPSLKNSLKSSTQNPGTDSGFHEKEKSQAQAQVQQNNNNVPTDSSLLGAPSSNISVQRTRRPSATSSKSGFSETSSLAPPRSEISEISNTSSNPRSVFSTSPIPTCVLKDITERENGFRRSAGIPEGLGIGEDGEEHADYRWAKSRLRRKEIGTSTILFASSLSYHLSQLSTSEWVHRSAWELDYLEMCVFRSSLVAERFPPPGTQIVPSTSAYHFQNQEGTSKENDRTNLCPMPNVDGSWNSLKWKNWLGTVKEGQIIVPAVSWQTWWTLISVLNGADGSGRSYNLQVKTPEEPFEELTDMNAVYI